MKFKTNNQDKKEKSSTGLLLLLLLLVVLLGGGGYYLYTSGMLDSLGITGQNQASNALNEVISQTDGQTSGSKSTSGGSRRTVPGKKIGNLFIPSQFDEEAYSFLKEKENTDKIPIQVEDNETHKDNPFLK
jgi:hypothetical protein